MPFLYLIFVPKTELPFIKNRIINIYAATKNNTPKSVRFVAIS